MTRYLSAVSHDAVTIEISHGAALVLFESLSSNDLLLPLGTPSESDRAARWHLEAQLEKTLEEPLAANYRRRGDCAAAARWRL